MKASVFIATSLDGFIARENGGLDWLPENGGEPHGYDEFMATVDAVVIGRRTYETVLGFEKWPYGAKPVIVLSTTLSELNAPDGAVCELFSCNPSEVMSRLAGRGINHIYVDGGVTIQGYLRAGLIQRMTITRIPVLLGTGISLFGPVLHDIRFQHMWTKSYRSGMVQSEYALIG
jgi:dihydrofolate reductase